MKLPDEIKFLFEGSENDYKEYVEKNRNTLEEFGLEKEDLEDLEDEDLDFRRQFIFSYLFTESIDWREFDEEVIVYLSKMIPDEKVSVETNKVGLLINYNGIEHQIKLSFSPADRYITIRGFNRIIAPKYEARVMSESLLNDTHSLIVLPTEDWQTVEKMYPDTINKFFIVIDETTDF